LDIKTKDRNEFTEYKNIKVNDIPEPIIDIYKKVNYSKKETLDNHV